MKKKQKTTHQNLLSIEKIVLRGNIITANL